MQSLDELVIATAKYVECSNITDTNKTIENLVDGKFNNQIIELVESEKVRTCWDAIIYLLKISSIQQNRDFILNDFLTYSKWELLSQIVYRTPYKEAIRNVLKRHNKYSSSIPDIFSSRFDYMYSKYVKWFEKAVGGYYINDSFKHFFAASFENFYFGLECTKDVWQQLREVDTAKLEIDKGLIVSKELHVKDTSDLKIGDLVKNIYQSNYVLFKHNGHNLNTIVYDIFHLIVDYSIQLYFKEINNKLSYFNVQLIDNQIPYSETNIVYDNGNSQTIKSSVKGAISKINNGKQMIPIIFEYIKDKKININFIGDLREIIFELGKNSIADSNCIWKLSGIANYTEQYIDTEMGTLNYLNFEIILKGVASVYILIVELKKRGISPVDIYDKDLFTNLNIIRYLDYLSSIKYKDLILQLQKEHTENSTEINSLDTFEEMLNKRAGSSENNKSDNQLRRQYALLNGLINGAKLKKRKNLSDFEKLYNIYLQIHSIPKTLDIFYDICKNYQLLSSKDFDTLYKERTFKSNYIGTKIIRKTKYNAILNSLPLLSKQYIKNYESYDCSYYLTGIPILSDNYMITVIYKGNFYYPDKQTQKYFIENQYFSLDDLKKIDKQTPNILRFKNARYFVSNCTKYFPMRIHFEKPLSLSHKENLSKVLCHKESKIQCENFLEDYFSTSSFQEEYINFTDKLIYILSALEHDESVTDIVDNLGKQFLNLDFIEETLDDLIQLTFLKYYNVEPNNYSGNLLKLSFTERLIFSPFINSDTLKQQITQLDANYLNRPYAFKEFMDLELDFSSPSKMYVQIYNYLNAKLTFLEKVWDGYEMFYLTSNEIELFIAELNSHYNLKTLFSSLVNSIPKGMSIDTLENDVLINLIHDTYKVCFSKHDFLIKNFENYIDRCMHTLDNILDYSTRETISLRENFEDWGHIFNMCSPKKNISSLELLRQKYKTDNEGFFIKNGEYLLAYSSDKTITYYVHKTGNLLRKHYNRFVHADLSDIEIDIIISNI